MKFRSTFVGLAAALAAFYATPSHASGLQLLTDVAIAIPDQPGFGGLSAIEMDRDGRGAVVVSDRGAIFSVEIARDGGRVSGVGLRSASPLTESGPCRASVSSTAAGASSFSAASSSFGSVSSGK